MFGLFGNDDDQKKPKCKGCGKVLGSFSAEVKGGSNRYCGKPCMVKHVRRVTGQKD